MLAMQCSNGGWAAFDKDNDAGYVAKIPFSDFGETLDAPSVDVTAHVLEALGKLGYSKDFQPLRRGYEYIRSEQEGRRPLVRAVEALTTSTALAPCFRPSRQ